MSKKLRFLLFLSWRDFVSSYHGSMLGLIWALLEPTVYVSLTFFFFQFVMRGAQVHGHSYATFVLPPMLAWLVANTAVQSSMAAVPQYGLFLHESFELRLLALVKMLPIFVVHMLMLGFLIVFFFFNGGDAALSFARLAYAIFALACILTGIFWLLMSIGPFFKDVRNVVGLALQFGFWVTPIFWERSQIPGALSWVMLLNPFYHPVEAYRSAFNDVDTHLFLLEAAYFWTVCLLLLLLGNRVYVRAKPHFGDVVT